MKVSANYVLQGTPRSACARSARALFHFTHCARASREDAMRGAPEHGRYVTKRELI